MQSRTSVHPTDETLVDYGLGELDETVATSVNKHLKDCIDCRRRIAELSAPNASARPRDAPPDAARPAPDKGPVEQEPTRSYHSADKPVAAEGQAVSSSTLPPGLLNHPQYEVLRELGRGGMGVVYLARNTLMDRLEVLKVLNKAMLEREGTTERFVREIQSAAKLHRANVVAAYSAFHLGDSLVFAMEYVEGEDLAKLVRARGPMPILNACYFAYQAAQGLQHAHERGMIHRDIKPGNLILFREGKRATVKILDFGLAKVRSERHHDRSLTQEGQMLGTPDYIAPEQTLDAQKADIRADIYSLGCTLYHLLAGTPPFTGNSLYEVLQAHHSVNAKPLNLVRPDIPAELDAVVAKMMAKAPQDRYQIPSDVARALKPFLKPGKLIQSSSKLPPVSSEVGAVGPPPGTDAASLEATRRWKTLIESTMPERPSQLGPIRKGRARRYRLWLWPVAVMALALLGAWMGGVFNRTAAIVSDGRPSSTARKRLPPQSAPAVMPWGFVPRNNFSETPSNPDEPDWQLLFNGRLNDGWVDEGGQARPMARGNQLTMAFNAVNVGGPVRRNRKNAQTMRAPPLLADCCTSGANQRNARSIRRQGHRTEASVVPSRQSAG